MSRRPPHIADSREPLGPIAVFLALPLAVALALGVTRAPAATRLAPSAARDARDAIVPVVRAGGAPSPRSDARPRR